MLGPLEYVVSCTTICTLLTSFLFDLIAHVPINMHLQNIGFSGAESLIVRLYFSKANIPGDLFNLL